MLRLNVRIQRLELLQDLELLRFLDGGLQCHGPWYADATHHHRVVHIVAGVRVLRRDIYLDLLVLDHRVREFILFGPKPVRWFTEVANHRKIDGISMVLIRVAL